MVLISFLLDSIVLIDNRYDKPYAIVSSPGFRSCYTAPLTRGFNACAFAAAAAAATTTTTTTTTNTSIYLCVRDRSLESLKIFRQS